MLSLRYLAGRQVDDLFPAPFSFVVESRFGGGGGGGTRFLPMLPSDASELSSIDLCFRRAPFVPPPPFRNGGPRVVVVVAACLLASPMTERERGRGSETPANPTCLSRRPSRRPVAASARVTRRERERDALLSMRAGPLDVRPAWGGGPDRARPSGGLVTGHIPFIPAPARWDVVSADKFRAQESTLTGSFGAV